MFLLPRGMIFPLGLVVDFTSRIQISVTMDYKWSMCDLESSQSRDAAGSKCPWIEMVTLSTYVERIQGSVSPICHYLTVRPLPASPSLPILRKPTHIISSI